MSDGCTVSLWMTDVLSRQKCALRKGWAAGDTTYFLLVFDIIALKVVREVFRVGGKKVTSYYLIIFYTTA